MIIVNKKLNLKEFEKYIKGKNFKPNNPNKLVIHHTWKPTEKDWNGQKTIDALKKYYEGKGWNSAPHIFVAPDGIWLFTDMNTQGIHAGEGNYRSIGIEVVGNYDGAKWTGEIKRSAFGVIKSLLKELKLGNKDIKFHRDYSSKTCPGSAIKKEWIYKNIEDTEEEKADPIPTPSKPEKTQENANLEQSEPIGGVEGYLEKDLPKLEEEKKDMKNENEIKEDIIDKGVISLINLIKTIWKKLKHFFKTKE